MADPAAQRSAVGAALQEEVLARADEQGLPSYLETENSADLAYYARFGYETVEKLSPVTAGPPVWTMRRQPAA